MNTPIIPPSVRPEFFRLPAKGGDPYFGIPRSTYYMLERRGTIQLARIRERGKVRGITLVPYDAVAALMRADGGAL